MDELEEMIMKIEVDIDSFKDFTLPALLHKFGSMSDLNTKGKAYQALRDFDLLGEIISMYCDAFHDKVEHLIERAEYLGKFKDDEDDNDPNNAA